MVRGAIPFHFSLNSRLYISLSLHRTFSRPFSSGNYVFGKRRCLLQNVALVAEIEIVLFGGSTTVYRRSSSSPLVGWGVRSMDEPDEVLGLGKVSHEVLERSVFPFLPLLGVPELDGGMIQHQGRIVIAHSPSIGVPLEALGFFGFHYAASNVAARFARPRHMVIGIYLPLGTREEDLMTITRGLGEEAAKYGVTIVAGQTATYAGIEVPLLTATCIGEQLRQPRRPEAGDVVFIVGDVGGEAVWLRSLSEGRRSGVWRSFTPLPATLRLQGVEGVTLMHDVSEGGVKKALHEVASALRLKLEVESGGLRLVDGVEELGEDALRLPTYGSLIALVDPNEVDEVQRACGELGAPCAPVGVVKEGGGLYVDGVKVEDLKRIDLDRLYGSFEK
jgi:hydrogenase expression/formation protein HypE